MSVWQKQLTADASGQTWLVGIRGRLDQGLTPQLDKTLQSVLAEEQSRIVVDLSEVNYINSGGLRCLVAAWRKARQQGGDLVLAGLNQRLNEIFAIVGFNKVFQIFPTADTALQTLRKG
jgi:anti-sigma B factor antagonist